VTTNGSHTGVKLIYLTFATDAGRTLSYQRRGSGPLVVCLPGGPGMDPEAYFARLELPGHELLVFAPRGTGASSAPATRAGYRIAGYADDVEALRVHLGEERLTLYGNSHGACVALAYARAYPGRVERMVLTNGPARTDDAFTAAASRARTHFAKTFADGADRLSAAAAADAALYGELDEAERRRQYRTLMAGYVARLGPAETGYLDRLCAAPMNWEPAYEMSEEFGDGLDLLEGGQAVVAPTLAIGCEFDVTVPVAAMRLIAEALPNGQLLELTGVGHFPEVEAPAEFRAAVTPFLASRQSLRDGSRTA
jgi:pimeloyl-ACP methyl ester carboxylesterase